MDSFEALPKRYFVAIGERRKISKSNHELTKSGRATKLLLRGACAGGVGKITVSEHEHRGTSPEYSQAVKAKAAAWQYSQRDWWYCGGTSGTLLAVGKVQAPDLLSYFQDYTDRGPLAKILWTRCSTPFRAPNLDKPCRARVQRRN